MKDIKQKFLKLGIGEEKAAGIIEKFNDRDYLEDLLKRLATEIAESIRVDVIDQLLVTEQKQDLVKRFHRRQRITPKERQQKDREREKRRKRARIIDGKVKDEEEEKVREARIKWDIMEESERLPYYNEVSKDLPESLREAIAFYNYIERSLNG